jgi:hypothetical protein
MNSRINLNSTAWHSSRVLAPAAALAVAGLMSSGAAQAQLALSADLGTTGVGAHLSMPLQPNLNARVGFNFLNYSYNTDIDDINYDFKLKLRTFDALLDYFPTDGGFRISGGLSYNGNKIDAVGLPNGSGTYVINGTVYTAASAGRIDGRIDFRKAAPYLGIGWGNPVKAKGWGFTADLGVLFQGSPKTNLANSGCTAPAADLADKADDYKFYPVLRIGASYRF